MASPYHRAKKSIDMAAPGHRVSRIRRDPPPPERKVTAGEVKEREAWSVVLGIAAMALALLIILVAISNAAGWSPSQYTIHIE